MKFFTSDIHLGDQATVENDLRPFKNAKVMAKKVIKKWNKQAKKGDVVYILGDFIDCDGEGCEGWREYLPWVKKIKADMVLITGNNEDRVIKYYFSNNYDDFQTYCLNLGFKGVHKNLDVEIGGQLMHLVHKPLEYKKNMINLFGHIHAAGGLYRPFGLNVGCDLFGYRLLSENDILHFLDKKAQYWDKDKHLNTWIEK